MNAPRNALAGAKRWVRRVNRDAQYLRRLEELRVGKPPDLVTLRVQRGNRVDVFFAPGGEFRDAGGGRWVYRDEFGRDWGRIRHERFARTHGRLPYGHIVLTERELHRMEGERRQRIEQWEQAAPGLEHARAGYSKVRYARLPLRQAHVDDARNRERSRSPRDVPRKARDRTRVERER